MFCSIDLAETILLFKIELSVRKFNRAVLWYANLFRTCASLLLTDGLAGRPVGDSAPLGQLAELNRYIPCRMENWTGHLYCISRCRNPDDW